MVRAWRPLWVMATGLVLVSMADELVDRLDLARMVELGLPDRDGQEAVVWFGLIWIAMTLLNMPLLVAAARRNLEAVLSERLCRTRPAPAGASLHPHRLRTRRPLSEVSR